MSMKDFAHGGKYNPARTDGPAEERAKLESLSGERAPAPPDAWVREHQHDWLTWQKGTPEGVALDGAIGRAIMTLENVGKIEYFESAIELRRFAQARFSASIGRLPSAPAPSQTPAKIVCQRSGVGRVACGEVDVEFGHFGWARGGNDEFNARCPKCKHVWNERMAAPARESAPTLCPKCNGQKHVNTPPWVAGDSPTYTTASTETYPCPVCKGIGYLTASPVLTGSPTRESGT